MDNIEFVKAYEAWREFEAKDTSPERFARLLELEALASRVRFLQRLSDEDVIEVKDYLPFRAERYDLHGVLILLRGDLDYAIPEGEESTND